jgi:hypothetical protein
MEKLEDHWEPGRTPQLPPENLGTTVRVPAFTAFDTGKGLAGLYENDVDVLGKTGCWRLVRIWPGYLRKFYPFAIRAGEVLHNFHVAFTDKILRKPPEMP